MSEVMFETRVQENNKEQLAGGARVVATVFENMARKDDNDEDEREGFVDIMVLAAKLRVNKMLRGAVERRRWNRV